MTDTDLTSQSEDERGRVFQRRGLLPMPSESAENPSASLTRREDRMGTHQGIEAEGNIKFYLCALLLLQHRLNKYFKFVRYRVTFQRWNSWTSV